MGRTGQGWGGEKTRGSTEKVTWGKEWEEEGDEEDSGCGEEESGMGRGRKMEWEAGQ